MRAAVHSCRLKERGDMFFAAYILLGAVAGYLGGLLGLGGGAVIVPVLYFLFRAQGLDPAVIMHLAVGTSLAAVVFTAVASTRAHGRRGSVSWPAFRGLVAGLVLGSFAGAAIADFLPGRALRIFFGGFELLVAAQLAWRVAPRPERALPGTYPLALVGTIIGILSTLLGIGGGVFSVLFLLWSSVPIRTAVGTSAACALPIAVAGSIGMIVAGWEHPGLPAFSAGYLYLPAAAGMALANSCTAPLGVATAHALPVASLQRVLALVLALVGVRMLLG